MVCVYGNKHVYITSLFLVIRHLRSLYSGVWHVWNCNIFTSKDCQEYQLQKYFLSDSVFWDSINNHHLQILLLYIIVTVYYSLPVYVYSKAPVIKYFHKNIKCAEIVCNGHLTNKKHIEIGKVRTIWLVLIAYFPSLWKQP